MRRVLVWSNDPVGATMAGPGIRSYHFARELAKEFEVTLVAPESSEGAAGLEVVPPRSVQASTVSSFDSIVAQRLPLSLVRRAVHAGVRLVYDLYVPFMIESLPGLSDGAAPASVQRARYEETRLAQDVALRAGSAFLCASERQRDLWLGALAAIGRIDPETYGRDPTLSSLVVVVPFGIEAEPPSHRRSVLRGVVPGVAEGDRILLWGGGIWDWFDPLTLIRAVGLLAARRNNVRLFFLGMAHPSAAVGEMAMGERAVALARELGVENRWVFFNRGWVPYAERQDYLLEADIGVSCHLAGVEARFAFRTRVLDYLWAGLPVVVTEGDVLAELVAERGLGRTVGPGDPNALVEAIEAVLEPSTHEATRAAVRDVAPELVWGRVVEPLVRLIGEGSLAAPPGRLLVPAMRAVGAQVASSVRNRGMRATIRASLRR